MFITKDFLSIGRGNMRPDMIVMLIEYARDMEHDGDTSTDWRTVINMLQQWLIEDHGM